MQKIWKIESLKYLRWESKKRKFIFFAVIFSAAVGNSLSYLTLIFIGKISDIVSGADLHKNIDAIWRNFSLFIFTRVGVLIAWRLLDFFLSKLEISGMKSALISSFEYVNKHSFRFFSDNQSWSIISKLRRLPQSIESFFDTLAYNAIWILVWFASTSVMLFFTNKFLFSIFLIFLVFFTVTIIWMMNKHMKYQQEALVEDSKLGGILWDVITNNINISVFASANRELENYKKQADIRWKKQRKNWYVMIFIMAIQRTLIMLFVLFLMYFTIKLLIQWNIWVWEFVIVTLYLWKVTPYFVSIWFVFRSMYKSINNIAEALEILKTPHEIVDKEWAWELVVKRWEIVFEDVDFEYEKWMSVFKKFNLKIKAWEKVWLVWVSGSWKTSITKLLFRFFDISWGRILIDSQDISKVKQDSLRKNISFVAQEPILFHRSLEENIKYWKPDASKDEFEKVCKDTHCNEFAETLNDWYSTMVGERWIKLSGWQKQRVAIARAMLEGAKIFVLDEATSSLDSESERLIQESLETMMQDKTSIVIAHRLSTIMKMDRILVMEDGKIVEEGKHEELLKKPWGKYKKLWNIQAWYMKDQNISKKTFDL